MATFRVPYLKMGRNGQRPRWEPGPKLRQRGFRGQDLKDDAGNWLPLDKAIAAAKELNKQTNVAARPKSLPARKTEQSFEALWERYKASNKFKKISKKTRSDYIDKMRPFLETSFAKAPVRSITKPALYGYYEGAQQRHGGAMANGIIAVVRRVLSYGELIGWLDPRSNPAFNLELDGVPPRLAIWLPQQVNVFMKAADELAYKGHRFHSVGDAFLIALHSAQRTSDVREMPDRIFNKNRICLTQMKRGALIDVKMTPQVKARVEQIRERRRDASITSIEAMIIDEITGRPYKREHFGKRFRQVREAAALELPKVDRDDRWSGSATIYEIADLTMQTPATRPSRALQWLAMMPHTSPLCQVTAWKASHALCVTTWH